MKRGISFIWIASVFIIGCTDVERRYYPSGELKYEVPLVNGEWEGIKTEYYLNGNVKLRSNWIAGKLNGKTTFYYDNGGIEQIKEYVDGLETGICEVFSEDGYLSQRIFFDSLGNPIDFIKYLKSGKQNLDIQSRSPIVIPMNDTIEFDETYISLIRLGNRRFQKIEVVLSDGTDKITRTNKLPMIDSVTAILSIKDHQIGENYIVGFIIEVNTNYPDSILVVPFKTKFFVRSLPNS